MHKFIFDQNIYYRKIKHLNIKHYAAEVPYYSQARLRMVEKMLLENLPKNSKILDLGCGSGRFSIGAARLGFKVFGLDICPEAIEAAIKRAQKNQLQNVKFGVCDMTQLSFPNNSFNFVFCPRFSINAVATYKNRKRAIEEMFRVVRPNGKVFVESFNKLYLGKGFLLPLKNIFRDLWRIILMKFFKLTNKEYNGLLPGDIIYQANKVSSAPVGYAHLPTIFELKKLVKNFDSKKFYSIPEITNRTTRDPLKYFRYSIWISIHKGLS